VWSPRVVDELRRCGCHVTQVQQRVNDLTSIATHESPQCSMGHQHAAVKTGTGDIWVWGSGARGQLGLGIMSVRGTSLPSKMPLPSSSAGSVIKVTH
jgi:alpha-tubulin suppressor-like RCC1 family protein